MLYRDACRLARAGVRALNRVRHQVLFHVLYGGNAGYAMSRPRRLYCWLFVGHAWKEEFAEDVHTELRRRAIPLSGRMAKQQKRRQINLAKRGANVRYAVNGYEGGHLPLKHVACPACGDYHVEHPAVRLR